MRLFVAINFSADTRRRLWQAAARLRAVGYPVKWVSADLLHLTVKFLGEVELEKCPKVEGALLRAVSDTEVFHLPVGGFGAFPDVSKPRVLWVGCENLPVLELLHDSVERSMDKVGFPTDGKMFRPHATVGRVAHGARPAEFKGLSKLLEGMEFREDAEVVSLDLMCSKLSPRGPKYELVAQMELRR